MLAPTLLTRLFGQSTGGMVWRGPGIKHQRRIERLVFTGCGMVIAGAGYWGVFFALRRQWLGVCVEVALTLCGLVGIALARRQRYITAGYAVLVPLLVAIWGVCLVIDIPTPGVPRSFHHLLPALGACGYVLLRGRPVQRWVTTAVMFVSYVLLDGLPMGLFGGTYNLPDDVRQLSNWSYNVASMLSLYLALHIMQADVAERNKLEQDLREAVIQGQFLLHYQPQVADDGRVIGAEALVRWQHPRHGMVPPSDFIPLAEQTGLIVTLGDWVLKQACAQLAAWAATPETASLKLSVNVSAHQIRQPDFVARVLAAVERAGVDPSRLKLELTESMLVNDVEDLIGKMTELRRHGVGFSLDDFGTGYSSLSYLRRLPLDQLKIDQAFVRDVLGNANDAAIAGTVVSLGQTLNLEVIAEGVETQAQRDFLLSIGCRLFQGYLYSKPVPEAAFGALVVERAREAAAMAHGLVPRAAGMAVATPRQARPGKAATETADLR
ncbi:MAG TPA: EAL domain-containing protein [Candidatus Aquabacterium excrementipullorum]|nr:EAL domain-containing protein [Candidatus Aquabacterium excrementipullorum]